MACSVAQWQITYTSGGKSLASKRVSQPEASSSFTCCVILEKCLALPSPSQCVGLDHTGVPALPTSGYLPCPQEDVAEPYSLHYRMKAVYGTSLENLQAAPHSDADIPSPLLHSLDSGLTVPGPLSTLSC